MIIHINHFKLILNALILGVLLSSCNVQTQNTYTSKKITTSLQEEIDKHGTIEIEIEEDGKTIKKEIIRSKVDSLDQNQLSLVNQLLASRDSNYLVSNDFMFIMYYPGKDPCNSSGWASRDDIGKTNEKFKTELSKKGNISSIYICKSPIGVERWEKGINYESDVNQIIENAFFDYHYPCSSYVILHKDGLYYAYYGESWVGKQMLDVDLFTYHF